MTSMFKCLAKLLHLEKSKHNRAKVVKEEQIVEEPAVSNQRILKELDILTNT